MKLGLAKVTLVGAKAEIEAKAAELGVDLTGVMHHRPGDEREDRCIRRAAFP